MYKIVSDLVIGPDPRIQRLGIHIAHHSATPDPLRAPVLSDLADSDVRIGREGVTAYRSSAHRRSPSNLERFEIDQSILLLHHWPLQQVGYQLIHLMFVPADGQASERPNRRR